MATGKTPTTDQPGKAKQTTPKKTRGAGKPTANKPRASAKPRTKPKTAPVVLDPPKRPAQNKRAAKSTSQPEIIDVQAVEVARPTKAGAKDEKPDSGPNKAPEQGDVKKPTPADSKPPRPSSRLLGVSALFLGGLAVVLGYFVVVKTLNRPPDAATETATQIKAMQSTYTARINDLESRITALETAPRDAVSDTFASELEALHASLQDQDRTLSDRLAATQAQIKELAGGTKGSGSNTLTAGSLAGVNSEIDVLKQRVEGFDTARKKLASRVDQVEQQAQAELVAARTKARNLAKKVELAKSGLDMRLEAERLSARVDAGRPYADLLTRLAAGANVPIPETLISSAEAGVASLAQLQNDFPDAARLALKQSIKAGAGPGFTSRLTAFLEAQLGARSLEPREGDDPDAVLSRAEAALTSGDLKGAVALGRQLPDSGVAAMKAWLERAENRLAVTAALAEFSSALAQN